MSQKFYVNSTQVDGIKITPTQDNKIRYHFYKNSPPILVIVGIKIVRVSREEVHLRLTPPGRQPWKISLKTCNYVTLACKRGSALKHK